MVNVLSNPIYFIGEFPHTLDAKNRVTIPARWRSDDPDAKEAFIIVPHPDELVVCLLAMSPEEFHAVARKVENSDQISEETKREFISEWYASGRDSVIDKQGRLLLPEDYCQLKNLRGELVLVGAKERIEIWHKEARQQVRMRRQPMRTDVHKKVGI